jgi:hypothetical protein
VINTTAMRAGRNALIGALFLTTVGATVGGLASAGVSGDEIARAAVLSSPTGSAFALNPTIMDHLSTGAPATGPVKFHKVANTSPLPGQGCAHASTQGLAHGLGKRCAVESDAYTVTQVVHVDAGTPAYVQFPAHAAGDTPDPASLTITSTPDDPNAPADVAVLNNTAGDSGDGWGNTVFVKIRNNGGAATVTLTVSFVSASAPAA